MAAPDRTRHGRYTDARIGGEVVRTFHPCPLPPDPPIRMDLLAGRLEQANRGLGRLDGVASVLPDPTLFLYSYIRKEALLSSQIEGTQSSFSQLLLFESEAAPGIPAGDVVEVSNYVAAMETGLDRLRRDLPLSLRLIRELHARLVTGTRGEDKDPGEFRRTQNWIGGTRPGNAAFVPPPPSEVVAAMGDLELFIHARAPALPSLIKAGLVHVQFESIHPFLDGNGRLGRLLVTFVLCAEGALRDPVLYLSLYLKQHRDRYYALLQAVRDTGDWEEWLDFFLAGIEETSNQAVETARRLLAQFEADRRRIEALGRVAGTALRVHHLLQRRPITSAAQAAAALSLSIPTVTRALRELERAGIVAEATGRKRGRLYAYRAVLDVLSEGTEPLPR